MKIQLFLLMLIGCICGNSCLASETNFQTQLGLNQQSKAKFEETDQRLQKICFEIRLKLGAESLKKFDTAQAAWLVFRKADAESYANEYLAGSIYPLIYATAMTDTSERRIAQLQIQLDDLKRQ
jgi:uncharacterized protein YecT (DUF1311 family)